MQSEAFKLCESKFSHISCAQCLKLLGNNGLAFSVLESMSTNASLFTLFLSNALEPYA